MSTTYQVLFSASAVQPASDAEDSTAGQTAGDSDCYKLEPSTTSGERLATCHCSRS